MALSTTSTCEKNDGATACIILARGGSKGVPKKNLQKIGGISLIGRSVRAGKAAKSVAEVFVSTDDHEIAAEAELYGARVIKRPDELSGDTATSEAGWLHAISIIREEFTNLEKLVFLQCTSPFTTGADIDACLNEMLKNNADCALSVLEDHSFLWTVDENGKGIGANHDALQQRKRRQDLPPQYRESGAIYCVSFEPFLRIGRRFCGSVALHVVDHPPVEIDTIDDLEFCSNLVIGHRQSDVPKEIVSGVKAIVMDFDGVHTDNLVVTDQEGNESVRTSRGDGMGISMLRETKRFEMLILSKERNPVVAKRAEKLKLDVLHSIDDKVAVLESWLDEKNLGWDNLLYVGNDINDLDALIAAGCAVCPQDAHPKVLRVADWILPFDGGHGALRHMADCILAQHSE